MNQSSLKVEGLKKISLRLEAGTGPDTMDLTKDLVSVELVVGVDVEGFTPFEYELLGKKTGENVQMEIKGWRFDEMFGRLEIPLPEEVKRMDSFFLTATVEKIETPEQSEIVRAMAGRVGDCGGDCCGHH